MIDIGIEPFAIRAYYLFYMGGVSTFILYISIFCQTLGMNTTELGTLGFTSSLIGFTSRALFGGLTDKFNCAKIILFITPILAGISFNCMMLIPKSSGLTATLNLNVLNNTNIKVCTPFPKTNNTCWPQEMKYCTTHKYFTIQTRDLATLKSAEQLNNKTNQTCVVYKTDKNNLKHGVVSINCQKVTNYTISKCDSPFKTLAKPYGTTFLLILLIRSLGFLFYTPGLCILDAVLLKKIKNAQVDFGLNRMFGSAGFIVFSLIIIFTTIGSNNDSTSDKNYAPSLYMYMAISIAMAISILFVNIPSVSPTNSKDEKSVNFNPFGFKHPSYVAFYTVCFIGGICLSVLEDSLFVVIDMVFKPDMSFFHYLTLVFGISEALGNGAAGFIIQKLGEPICLCLSLVIWGLRFFLSSVVPSKWMILGVELFLHGGSFALMTCCITTYSGRIAPKGYESTVQGFAQALYMGLGNAFGSKLGGYGMTYLGPRRHMQCVGGFMVLCAVLYALTIKFFPQVPADDELMDTELIKKYDDEMEKE